MVKKIISFLLMFSVCTLRVSALTADSVSAECAVVMNVQTGEVLFSKNPDKRRSMASTTKIMTSLIAIESGKLQSEIIISDIMTKVEGTSMGLLPGDSVSLDELVYGMMLPSGNDAANATAIFLGKSTEKFALMMNERAEQLGMNNTNFVTASGLDDDEHYSTAYDMALLGSFAVRNPKFVSVCSSQKATVSFGNPPYLRTLYNHNKLLGNYDYAMGIKTGFTKKSGRCLVSYAKKDSAEFVAVTLNAPDDWNDHMLMFDYAFSVSEYEEISPELPDEISVVGGNLDSVEIFSEKFSYAFSKMKNLRCRIYLEKFAYAPVSKGTVVGHCDYYLGDELKIVKPIVITESVMQR